MKTSIHHSHLKACLQAQSQSDLVHPYVAAQRGVVLFLALVALLVMSLAAVALIRSVNTNTDITGNLGFKRAATASADAATEAAAAWLKDNVTNTALNANISANGYIAKAAAAGASKTGSAFWADFEASGVCFMPMTAAGACNAAESYDAAGNRVAFIIQRLCKDTGSRPVASCAKDPSVSDEGQSQESGAISFGSSTAIYYRIVVRVRGPRNAVSYVQTVVLI